VEEVLLQHPAIREASVIGESDAEWGEVVVACVVMRPDADVTDEALDAHCLAQIARFKRPKHYVRLAELPKNSYGKVLKVALREMVAAAGRAPSRATIESRERLPRHQGETRAARWWRPPRPDGGRLPMTEDKEHADQGTCADACGHVDRGRLPAFAKTRSRPKKMHAQQEADLTDKLALTISAAARRSRRRQLEHVQRARVLKTAVTPFCAAALDAIEDICGDDLRQTGHHREGEDRYLRRRKRTRGLTFADGALTFSFSLTPNQKQAEPVRDYLEKSLLEHRARDRVPESRRRVTPAWKADRNSGSGRPWEIRKAAMGPTTGLSHGRSARRHAVAPLTQAWAASGMGAPMRFPKSCAM
jgi:hypothetical protein